MWRLSEWLAFRRRTSTVIALGLVACATEGTGPNDDDTGSDTGGIRVTVTTTGVKLDADGFTVSIGGSNLSVDANGSVTFSNLTPGSFTVQLNGVALNCTVAGGTSQTVSVSSGSTATVTFTITCISTASAALSTITASPTTLPPDGSSTVTVQVRDGTGTALLAGGDAVTLFAPIGLISAVTDNNDGTYGATFSADMDVGTATITGTLNGTAIADNATITIAAPTAAIARIEVVGPNGFSSFDCDCVPGTTVQLTATAFDANDVAIANVDFNWSVIADPSTPPGHSTPSRWPIDQNGLITVGGEAGYLRFIAEAGGVADTTDMIGAHVLPDNAAITPTTTNLHVGQTVNLSTNLTKGGVTVPGVRFRYAANPAGIVTFAGDSCRDTDPCVVTAAAAGTATITVKNASLSAPAFDIASTTTTTITVTASGGTVVWTFDGGESNGFEAAPAVADNGTIYATTWLGNELFALNADGSEQWSVALPTTFTNAAPSIATDGTIYVAGQAGPCDPGQPCEGQVFAYNPNGTRKWAFNTSTNTTEQCIRVSASPAIGSDGTVYVSYMDGLHPTTFANLTCSALFALNPSDGSIKWRFDRPNSQNSGASGGSGFAPVVSADGSQVFAPGGTSMWIVNASTGASIAEFFTSGIVTTPALATDGTIYVGGGQNMHALNPNLSLKWFRDTGDLIGASTLGGGSSPAVGADGTIYIGNEGSDFLALDPATGNINWTFDANGSIRSAPAIAADGTIYIGTRGGRLHAVNPDGTERWTYTAGTAGAILIMSSPAIAPDGTVYFGASNNSPLFHAVDGGDAGGLANTPWPKFQRNNKNTGR